MTTINNNLTVKLNAVRTAKSILALAKKHNSAVEVAQKQVDEAQTNYYEAFTNEVLAVTENDIETYIAEEWTVKQAQAQAKKVITPEQRVTATNVLRKNIVGMKKLLNKATVPTIVNNRENRRKNRRTEQRENRRASRRENRHLKNLTRDIIACLPHKVHICPLFSSESLEQENNGGDSFMKEISWEGTRLFRTSNFSTEESASIISRLHSKFKGDIIIEVDGGEFFTDWGAINIASPSLATCHNVQFKLLEIYFLTDTKISYVREYWDEEESRWQQVHKTKSVNKLLILKGITISPDIMINSYGKSFEFADPDPQAIGVELEVIQYGTIAGKTATILNELVDQKLIEIKRDGSLSGGDAQFEIVSAPLTVDETLKVWKEIFVALDASNISVNDTCGMHVHVNREWFVNSEHAAAEFTMKFHEEWNEIVKISGRKKFDYCKDALAEYVDTTAKIKAAVKIAKKATSDRYVAINCQNMNTIEFRIFAGTRDWRKFEANIEFVKNLCESVQREQFTYISEETFEYGDPRIAAAFQYIKNATDGIVEERAKKLLNQLFKSFHKKFYWKKEDIEIRRAVMEALKQTGINIVGALEDNLSIGVSYNDSIRRESNINILYGIEKIKQAAIETKSQAYVIMVDRNDIRRAAEWGMIPSFCRILIAGNTNIRELMSFTAEMGDFCDNHCHYTTDRHYIVTATQESIKELMNDLSQIAALDILTGELIDPCGLSSQA